jgi:hypothetical protein
LIPREQQPKVSHALELCRYNLHNICDSYLHLGYMQLNI